MDANEIALKTKCRHVVNLNCRWCMYKKTIENLIGNADEPFQIFDDVAQLYASQKRV